MTFERVRAEYDDNGRRRLVPTGEPDEFHPCDEVLIAVGQESAFPWIERDAGIEFGEWDMPVVDKVTPQSSLPHVLFGGEIGRAHDCTPVTNEQIVCRLMI